MQAQMTIDPTTPAFLLDRIGEFAAIAERLTELMVECHSTSENVLADLFDSDGVRVGAVYVARWEVR